MNSILTRANKGRIFELLKNEKWLEQNKCQEYFTFKDTDDNVYKKCKFLVIFGEHLNFGHYCHLLKKKVTPENVKQIEQDLKKRSKHEDKNKRISNVKGMDALTFLVTDDFTILRYEIVHECKINKSNHFLGLELFLLQFDFFMSN